MKKISRKYLTAAFVGLLKLATLEAQVTCPTTCTPATYCIYYNEDFTTTSPPYPVGDFYPNGVQNSNWHQLYTTLPTVIPRIVEFQPGSKLLQLHLNSGTAVGSGLVSVPALDPSSCFSGSGIGPSGSTERKRWAVISEFFLRNLDPGQPNVVADDHILTALRVIPTTDQTDQSRFGTAIAPKIPVDPPSPTTQAFLQFSNSLSTPPGFTVSFRLSDPIIPSNNEPGTGDYIFRFDGTVRYAATFEEWEQLEVFGWRLHWKGTVYRVDTSTSPWTYVNLGSLEQLSEDTTNVRVCQSPGVNCIAIPDLPGSKLLYGHVYRQIDADLRQVYAAFWKF